MSICMMITVSLFQYWMLSKDGEIRRDESCVDYAGQDVRYYLYPE